MSGHTKGARHADLAIGILQLALKAEHDWHEVRWDMAMDEARECSHRNEVCEEASVMRRAKAHAVRMKAIEAAFTALKNLTSATEAQP